MLYTLIVFVCNTVGFLALLKNRYMLRTTLIAAAASLPASLLVRALLLTFARASGPFTPLHAEVFSSVLMLFCASLVLFTNSFIQKLSLALWGMTNYLFVWRLCGYFCSMWGTTGIAAELLRAFVYLLVSFFTLFILYRPFHFFARQLLCATWVGILLLQLLLFFSVCGWFDDLFSLTLYPPQLALQLTLYVTVLFFYHMFYAAAAYGARAAAAAARENHLQAKSEYYAAMLVNQRTVQSALQSPGDTAADPCVKAMLEPYCENPYANAVIATHASRAAAAGIRFECACTLKITDLSTLELCTLIGDLLSKAYRECENCAGQDAFIRLSIVSARQSLVIELVNSCPAATAEPQSWKKLLRTFFTHDDSRVKKLTSLDDTGYIIAQHGGALHISRTQEQTITRAEIQKI